MKLVLKNIKETALFAKKILKIVSTSKNKSATVLALYGDLGSGKTAFTKELAKLLGIKESVISPTFIIERIYKIKKFGFTHLIHIDSYRLDSPRELQSIGWSEISSDPKNLIVVEWADKVESLLPKESLRIKFSFLSEEKRGVQFPYAS